MDKLYSRFIPAGQLAFYIGSHVGDRIGSFRRNGARVVAVEPQPLCAHVIRSMYSGDSYVTVVEAACGKGTGSVTMWINSDNPTVSTASRDFQLAAKNAPGWQNENWDQKLEVPCI